MHQMSHFNTHIAISVLPYIYHTSKILMFALEVELTLPFSRSKGMVSLAIVQCALPPPDLSFQAFPSSTIFYLTLLTSN